MEVERIQPAKQLKVERTGSEQERRRQREDVEEFHELLESNLEEESRDEPNAGPADRQLPTGDTVSITDGAIAGPLVEDFVSISTQARLSAQEDSKAAMASADDAPPVAEPASDGDAQPRSPESAAAESPEETEGEAAGIDTIA